MRLTWSISLALILALGTGCDTRREAELLDVTSVDPAQLAPGRTVRVRGSGFPPGRSARIRLEGMIHRPGRAPEPASVELEGSAVSAEEIEARFTAEAFEGLGGRGTLHGRVVAIFEAANDRGRVVGRSDELQIDIVPGSGRHAPGELGRRREASELVDRLGIHLEEEVPEVAGLRVSLVIERSTAERAGLVAGDRLVAAEGVLVHDLGDVLPQPGADTIALRLTRSGEAAPFAVVLPIEADARAGVHVRTARFALAALGWVLLILLFLAPTAGLADWLARRGTRRTARTGGWRALWRRHRADVPMVACGLALLGSLPALDAVGFFECKLEAVLLGALALRTGAAWLATSGETTRARLAASLVAVASVTGVGIALGALAALGGTSDLGALAEQPSEPWRWTLLTTPIAGPALGLVVLSCACSQPPAPRRGARALALAIDDVVLLAIAATVTAMVLGGWGRGSPEGAERLVRALAFTTFALGGWLFFRRSRRAPRLRALLVGAVLSVIVVVGTVAQIALEPPAVLVEGVARVIGGAATLLALSALFRVLGGRLRREPAPLARFA